MILSEVGNEYHVFVINLKLSHDLSLYTSVTFIYNNNLRAHDIWNDNYNYHFYRNIILDWSLCQGLEAKGKICCVFLFNNLMLTFFLLLSISILFYFFHFISGYFPYWCLRVYSIFLYPLGLVVCLVTMIITIIVMIMIVIIMIIITVLYWATKLYGILE